MNAARIFAPPPSTAAAGSAPDPLEREQANYRADLRGRLVGRTYARDATSRSSAAASAGVRTLTKVRCAFAGVELEVRDAQTCRKTPGNGGLPRAAVADHGDPLHEPSIGDDNPLRRPH